MFQKDKYPLVFTIKGLRPLIFPIEVFTRIDDQKYSLVLVFLCGGIYLFLENIKVREGVLDDPGDYYSGVESTWDLLTLKRTMRRNRFF